MATTTQNYILYRTVALMYQPGYSYAEGATPSIPAAQVASAKGTVIATRSLTSLTGVTAPDGWAYALDAAGAYPGGSGFAPVASTAYTLSGAATATAGTALELVLTPNDNGPGGATTVTLSDGGAGGAFSAPSVTFAAGDAAARTVTYTPKAAGSVTLSATNTGGLTDPASLIVTVGAAATS